MKKEIKEFLTGLIVMFAFLFIGACGGCLDGNSFKLALFFAACVGGCFYGAYKLNEEEFLDQF